MFAVTARNSPQFAVLRDDGYAEDDDGDGNDPGQEVDKCQLVDDVLAGARSPVAGGLGAANSVISGFMGCGCEWIDTGCE